MKDSSSGFVHPYPVEMAAIAVHECGEELIDLRTINVLRLDARLTDGEDVHARLRIGVVDRLVIAQTLLPPGFKFLIVEGWLPGAPHVAGAAVDLTLCTVDGAELDGADPPHRTTMATALEAAGFVNHPRHWWHWSYGDRGWAHLTGARHAHYGPIDP